MYKRIIAIVCVVLIPLIAIGQNVNIRASWYVDGAKVKYENRSHTALESASQGASVVYATNGVELILTKLRMNKTSGGILDDDRKETGRNSALLADELSQVLLEGCEVTSHASQADGVTANGKGTKVTLQEGKVVTNKSVSNAVSAINGAEIIVQKTEVNTTANQSPAFFAHNDGEIKVTEAFGQNGGQASPSFYVSSAVIRAEKCRLSSGKWTIGSVDTGLLEVTGSELKAGGVCGFLVYGANNKVSELRALDKLVLIKNTITVTEGPLILVTNAGGEISLSKNKISCRNDEIIAVKADDWGPKGSNMGNAIIDLDKQTLNGDIYVDSISSLELNLNKGGKLNGRITGNPCDGRTVNVCLKKGSAWTAKGDVYVNRIVFEQPLKKGLKQLKGKHVIYYDPDDAYNSPLEGKEHKTAGGVLRPMKK
jgi:hypothetical protein